MNNLPYEKLLKYMELVFDTEINVLIQTETINRLSKTYNSLGHSKKYNIPQKEIYKQEKGCGGCIVFPIILLIVVISIILGYGLSIKPFIPAIIIIAVLFLACLIGKAHSEKDKKENLIRIENDYVSQMNKYNLAVEIDKRRVEEENRRKTYIRQQINELDKIRRKENKKLQELYSYDILAPKYRNLAAVSSIYEYLKYGRTKSLDVNGGDKGAYNIFEEEIRLNHIITNTEVIIKKLDKVIDNQRELSNAIQNANNSIKQLTSSVDRSSAQLASGIDSMNKNLEISNYEQRRQTAELDYMNFMNTLHLYK